MPTCVTQPDPELEGFFVVGVAVLFLGGVCCEGEGYVGFGIECGGGGGDGRKEGREGKGRREGRDGRTHHH